MKYKVSIIIPVYNVEKFIKKCLETVVNQTLREIEIIAVNDCSTDHSIDILKEYSVKYGDRFQIINSKENLRQGGARNLGLQQARGEYIGFVDPDDYIALDMFEKMYNTAKQKKADIVTCDYYEIADKKRVYKKNDLPEGKLNKEKLKEVLQRKYGWELWQQIYRRDLFIKNDIKFSENLYVTDLEIGALIIMYAQKISKVDEALYNYIRHDQATTSFKLNDKKIYDLITVCDKRVQHFKDRNLYEEYKDEIDYIYFWHVGIVSVFRCVNNFSKPQYDKIHELREKINNTIPNLNENYYYKKSSVSIKMFSRILLNHNIHLIVAVLRVIKLVPDNLKNKVKILTKK